MLATSPYRAPMIRPDHSILKLQRTIMSSASKVVEEEYQKSTEIVKDQARNLQAQKRKKFTSKSSLNESSGGSLSGSPKIRKSLYETAMNRRFQVEKDLHKYSQKLSFGD